MHIIDRNAIENPYHVAMIRDKLTRALPAVLPDVVDELRLAVPEHIPAVSGGTFDMASYKTSLINTQDGAKSGRRSTCLALSSRS